MKTTISNIPSDLVTEILTRVPLKSMRAIRRTCKNWKKLSKSQSFTKMHNDKAAKKGETHMIMKMGYNIYLTSIFINGDPSIENEGRLSCCLNVQVKIAKFFNCEGLLLCILKDDSRVVVWNPYLEQARWIVPRYSHSPYKWDKFFYSLGYEDKKNKSCRNHKLLRFIDYNAYSGRDDNFFWYEIYDFDSDLWKTLDVVMTPHRLISFPSSCVSLKGNTYWCAVERNSIHIICFDFTKERFGSLLPLPFSANCRHDYVTLSCVREEKLAALLQHDGTNPYELEIWITTKIETEEVLWSRFLRMKTKEEINFVPFICFCFFIDEEEKVAVGFDEHNRRRVIIIGDVGYFRKLDLVGEFGDQDQRYWPDRPQLCSYVPSLVQIKQPTEEGERKQKSDVEKRKYDQNMLRFVSHLKRFDELYGGGERQSVKEEEQMITSSEPTLQMKLEP